MAKFYGQIGFADQVQSAPGVVRATIVEYSYYGDVIRNTLRVENSGDKVNPDISLSNAISIVADAYLNEHYFAMRYVKWSGGYWAIDSVEVQAPRLIVRLGGVYNGETLPATNNP